MKKLALFLLSSFLFINSYLHAQTADDVKKFNKIEQLIEKNKVEKAEKKLISLLEESSNYGDAWDLYGNIKYFQYEQSKNTPNIFQNTIITTTDEDGNKIENSELSNSLSSLFASINPNKQAYFRYLRALRLAMAHSQTAYKSSMGLRHELHENDADTTLKEKEIELFKKAEKEFQSKNYNKAATYYQEALVVNPNYYKALLYLGDSYYMLENYMDAIKKFNDCIERFPNSIEPRKYLVDSYLNEGLYKDALQAAIESKTAYPDLIMDYRMLQAASKNGMINTVPFMERFVLPNRPSADSLIMRPLEKEGPNYEIPVFWNFYSAALLKIDEYCDSEGIIKTKTSLTNSNYLEVYSWETMLKESQHKDLDIAREMQKLGFLDCYVLLSCYHDDFYNQYSHFVKNNKEKVLEYYQNVVLKSTEY